MSDDVEAALAAMEDAGLEVEENEDLELAPEQEDEGVEQVEQKAERAPLPPEELAKRNEDLKKALKAERKRIQEIEDRYETRFQEALAKLTPKQEQQLEDKLDLDGIDPEANPLEALKALAGVVKGYKKQAEQITEQQKQEQARAEGERNLIAAIDRDAADYAEDVPDFYNARAHFANARFAMLDAAGYSKEEATNAVKYELMQIGARALQMRASPSEAIYKAAKAIGYGYKAPEQEGKEKIERMNAASKAGSKMAGGGASGGSGMTFKQIAGLKGAAFDKAMDAFLRG